MKRAARRAAVNRALIVVLCVVAVVAAGFWSCRFMRAREEAPAGELTEYQLWCPACKESFTLPADDAKTRAREGDVFECPKCKKISALLGGPRPEGMAVP